MKENSRGMQQCHLCILNPYVLVYISGESCASKTAEKSMPYILGQREYQIIEES
jgi:hypothetical protein